jgi:hypothetical protein
MDPGIALLDDLRREGLAVALVGGKILISPADRITEQLRNRIRARRQEAIEHLQLECQIQAMAERWKYTSDELAMAMAAAAIDPSGWRKWVERDERTFFLISHARPMGHA